MLSQTHCPSSLILQRLDLAPVCLIAGPNAISKLEQQLQAAKQADLDKLAHQVLHQQTTQAPQD